MAIYSPPGSNARSLRRVKPSNSSGKRRPLATWTRVVPSGANSNPSGTAIAVASAEGGAAGAVSASDGAAEDSPSRMAAARETGTRNDRDIEVKSSGEYV